MPVDFTYAVGRTRVLETRLLDKDRIERMIAAANADEVLRVLAETAYGSVASQINADEYEIMLNARLKEAYELVRHISPTPAVADILALKYDFHNLKVLLKDRYLRQHDDDILIGLGNVNPDELKAYVLQDERREIPDVLKLAIGRAQSAFEINHDPQDIDMTLDNAYYEAAYTIADDMHSDFVKELFRRQADMINIRTFVRVKAMGKDSRFLAKALLPGGYLDETFFIELMDQTLGALIDRLRFTHYDGLVDGIAEFERTGRLTAYERLMDDELLSYIRDNRSDPFGPAAIIGYLWALENETRIVRIIMVGKINHMPSDAIRQRVREVY
ncbi:V-type ATP synthase subunit C [Mahella sp.]|uniref:V-type ATP synthase subunit C n=1 Tax=Mahella sp. TaxID=2798721 RepID=UPI0025C21FFA|nr:V-type ATP synthase subunit C [Mahella sp.]MBZ4666360.1 H+transporting two-sector ATPase subunit [Mahella sp.]